MADQVAEAIAAAEAASVGVDAREVRFHLMPSGKPVKIIVPAELTDGECFALVEAMVQITRRVQAEQGKPKLAIPGLVLPT